MNVIKSDIVINGSRNRPILMDINRDNSNNILPIVVFIHGFKGFKDWGHFNIMAKHLVFAGFIVLKFNFSFNGIAIENPTEFNDLEAFGQNNLTTELNDLGCIIDYISKSSFANTFNADVGKIYIIGHSRGGGVGLLKAHEDNRISKVIGLAPLHKIGTFFTTEEIKEWEKTGVRYEKNNRTGQMMPIYWQYIEDIRYNIIRLDIPAAISTLSIPTLIIHGTKDNTINFINSVNIRKLNPDIEIVLIDNADHNFGGKHPWTVDNLPQPTIMWLDEAISFLKQKN